MAAKENAPSLCHVPDNHALRLRNFRSCYKMQTQFSHEEAKNVTKTLRKMAHFVRIENAQCDMLAIHFMPHRSRAPTRYNGDFLFLHIKT